MAEDIAAKQREQRQQIEDREAARYNDMVAERNRADRFIQEWQIHHDQGERAKQVLQKEQWQREAEGDIADVRIRALIAAGESRDFVQAVRREGAMITQEHADLQRDIALENNPDKKQSLELKRDIQHSDYMALANERIAAMSNLNSEQHQEAQRQQEEWARIGTELRKERLALQERMALDEAQKISQAVEQQAAAEQINRADRQREEFRSDIRGPITPASQPAPDATQEAQSWRPVGPDEVLQPGAHVRMDMQTGQSQVLQPETAAEAAQTHQAARAASAPGQPERPVSEAERPAEIIHSEPSVPVGDIIRQQHAARENRDNTDRENTYARQSSTAENVEMTDAKAARKAAWAAQHTQTEQAIESGRDRGYEHSR